jgi:hypothetical protein
MRRFFIFASIFIAFAAWAQAELIDNHDGTITQIRNDGSRLMWMQDANYAKLPDLILMDNFWVTAVNWTSSVNFAGYTGWRLQGVRNTASSGGYSAMAKWDLYYNELGNAAGNFANSGPFST